MAMPTPIVEWVKSLERAIEKDADYPNIRVVQDIVDFYHKEPRDAHDWFVGDKLLERFGFGESLEEIYAQVWADPEPGEDVMTLEEMRTSGQVALHWPPLYRRLDKPWIWHYEQWVLETFPGDGARRGLRKRIGLQAVHDLAGD